MHFAKLFTFSISCAFWFFKKTTWGQMSFLLLQIVLWLLNVSSWHRKYTACRECKVILKLAWAKYNYKGKSTGNKIEWPKGNCITVQFFDFSESHLVYFIPKAFNYVKSYVKYSYSAVSVHYLLSWIAVHKLKAKEHNHILFCVALILHLPPLAINIPICLYFDLREH